MQDSVLALLSREEGTVYGGVSCSVLQTCPFRILSKWLFSSCVVVLRKHENKRKKGTKRRMPRRCNHETSKTRMKGGQEGTEEKEEKNYLVCKGCQRLLQTILRDAPRLTICRLPSLGNMNISGADGGSFSFCSPHSVAA